MTVGPLSVGFELHSKALVFGGDTMTSTDIAVASGFCDIGDKEKVKHISEEVRIGALVEIKRKIEAAMDRVKVKIYVFIIWLAPQVGKMNQITRCDWLPERARWSHLAHSGLPAVSRRRNFLESHIINPLMTKFVKMAGYWPCSFFVRLYGPRVRVEVYKRAKKNLANFQPS